MTLANKTIVVTGCCSGIGADFAKLARLQGARVIGIDRNDPTLSLDGFVKADLGDTKSIDDAVSQLPERIDALANIAGVPGTAPSDAVARVNYLGLRHLIGMPGTQLVLGGSLSLGAARLLARATSRADASEGAYSVNGAVAFGSVRRATALDYGGLGLSGVEGIVFRDRDGDGRSIDLDRAARPDVGE